MSLHNYQSILLDFEYKLRASQKFSTGLGFSFEYSRIAVPKERPLYYLDGSIKTMATIIFMIISIVPLQACSFFYGQTPELSYSQMFVELTGMRSMKIVGRLFAKIMLSLIIFRLMKFAVNLLKIHKNAATTSSLTEL